MKISHTVVWLGFSLLAFGAGWALGHSSSTVANESQMTFAVVDGQAIKGSEVLPRIQSDLDQIEKNTYELKKRAVLDLIREKNLGAAAAMTPAVPPGDFSKEEISPDELKKFLAERNINAKKLSKKEMESILNNMKLQKYNEKRKSAETEQVSKIQIQWKIPKPASQMVKVEEGPFPTAGVQRSNVDVVVFGNYHCPQCALAEERLSQLRSQFKDQVSFHYRFLMDEPDSSLVRASAEATACAADQTHFWEYRDVLAAHPPMEFSDLQKVASDLKLDAGKFSKCLADRTHKIDIEKDIQAAHKAGLTRPPVFVINREMIQGNASLDEMKNAIQEKL